MKILGWILILPAAGVIASTLVCIEVIRWFQEVNDTVKEVREINARLTETRIKLNKLKTLEYLKEGKTNEIC